MFLFLSVVSLVCGLGTGLTAGVSVDVCDCGGDVCDCRNSNFETFPLDIPQSAVVWNFNGNNLFEFSTTDLSVDSVVELHLSDNNLGYFRDTERKHWSSLELLDLSKNNLRWIPLTLFNRMKVLQSLNISKNNLINIDQVKFPPFLTNLDISSNSISSISRRFLNSAHNLQNLNLSNNSISRINSKSFSHLKKLEKLNLFGNNLSELTNAALYGLVSCHYINLGSNQISDISNTAFVNYGIQSQEIKKINLENNKISIILADWVKEIENEGKYCKNNDQCSEYVKISLEGNPLYCDCNLMQVRDRHFPVFGDLEITKCSNGEHVTLAEFHDEICCDVSNT